MSYKSTYKKIMPPWLEGKCCRMCSESRHGHICVHHSRGRLGILLIMTEYWIPLCLKHHNWCHSHISEARDLGIICEKGLWNTI